MTLKDFREKYKIDFEEWLVELLMYSEITYVIDESKHEMRLGKPEDVEELINSGKPFTIVFDKYIDPDSINIDFEKVYAEDDNRD